MAKSKGKIPITVSRSRSIRVLTQYMEDMIKIYESLPHKKSCIEFQRDREFLYSEIIEMSRCIKTISE